MRTKTINATSETFSNTDIMLDKDKLKNDTVELVANQIYDKMTKLFNDARQRLGIKGGANMDRSEIIMISIWTTMAI